jgi:selenocysteine lyase/cysteine desulfurase
MEHHSNELPWRRVAKVEHIQVDSDGRLSLDDYQMKLKEFGSRVKLVAVTGASNVSGYINDLTTITRAAHAVGARVLIDGAQLVPHRPIRLATDDPTTAIDFMVFSAHKMYAPFGVGVLVGDRKVFESGEPDAVGGGVVDIVNLEEAYWTDLPDKEEAGTPDIVGVVALGAAIALFNQLGWEQIIHHEEVLTRYALEQMKKVDKMFFYGDPNPARARERLGVISFNISGLPHTLTSAILSHEYGIGVRSGCFCAHLYVRELMKCSDERAKKMEDDIKKRDRSDIPGAVRISFGLYNTKEEIDQLIVALRKISAGEYEQDYQVDMESGEYLPPNFSPRFEQFFSFS